MSILSALLTQDKVVTPKKIDEAIQRQVISGGDFETSLLEVNALPEDCLSGYAALVRGMRPARREDVVHASSALIAQAPRALLSAISAIPLRVEDGVALVASAEPLGEDARATLERSFGAPVEARYANAARIAEALHRHLDLTPTARARRLIERLARLDPGELPDLSGVVLPSAHPTRSTDAASALAALDAALRDEGEGRTPSLPAPPRPRATMDPHQAPTSRPAQPESSPPGRMTMRVEEPRRTRADEPPSTRPLPARRQGADQVTLRAARVPDARELLGAARVLDREEAKRLLDESTDREGIVDVTLDHAAQSFEYVALFAVQGDAAAGISARGPGLVGAPLRGLEVAFSDSPALSRARVDGVVTRAAPSGGDRGAARSLRRSEATHPWVFPIKIRAKVALLLWADDGERIPSEAAIRALEGFLVDSAAAFTRLILQKKRASMAPSSAPPGTPTVIPTQTIAPRRSTLPSVQARAAALRSVLLTGERRSTAAPARLSVPPRPTRRAAEPRDPAHLVADLSAEGPARDEAQRALLALGEPGLSALFRQFPGKHAVIRADVGVAIPVASAQGPLLRAVVAAGFDAVPRLLASVSDPDPDTRFCAMLCLAEVLHPAAIPHLAALLTDPDYPTRMTAIEVLRRYRGFVEFSSVWPGLRAAIRDPRSSIDARRAAAYAAGELRDSGAVTALIATLSERDASLVAAARRALVALTRQDFGADVPSWVAWWDTASSRHRVEWLIDALTHADATIRHEAAEELKLITGQVFGYYFNLPRKERERAQQRYLAWWHAESSGRTRGDG